MKDPQINPVLRLSKASVHAHAEAHRRPAVPLANEVSEVWHWVVQGLTDPPFWGPVSLNDVHSLMSVEDGVLRWERHTEFWSVTYAGNGPPGKKTLKHVTSLDGELVTALRIFLTDNEATLVEQGELRNGFLLGGTFKGGTVEVLTDFWLRKNGCVNMVVRGRFADEAERGRFIKSLIDLEMYRVGALRGLTQIRPQFGTLERLEADYSHVTASLKELNSDRLAEALTIYKQLAIDTNQLLDSVRYRIAATKAYYSIVETRLTELDEVSHATRQTLSGFIAQRLKPGVDTVIAFDNRAKQLEASVTNSLRLYNAILENEIQQQNQQLLTSMEQSTKQQVRLAKAVEGFSVIALTYYAVGLLGYVGTALNYPFTAWIIAGAVPIIGVAVWLLTQWAKRDIQGS
mgnify:FL=1